jgi:hypothetical protein
VYRIRGALRAAGDPRTASDDDDVSVLASAGATASPQADPRRTETSARPIFITQVYRP